MIKFTKTKKMPAIRLLVLSGIYIWAVTFIAGMLMFSFHETDRPLFESLIAVVLVLNVIIANIWYFKNINRNYIKEGLKCGIIWALLNILIDLPIFLNNPINMSLAGYMKDIGISYLIIPVITVGTAWLLEFKLKDHESKQIPAC